ncbi:hypothetical protein HY989_00435 [Candidatus Micrarchaeota archaeon]|nr:hypothetical protein [Candidatus Micrarchaeota archaeon]
MEELNCKYCEGKFGTQEGLSQHMSAKHPDSYKEPKKASGSKTPLMIGAAIVLLLIGGYLVMSAPSAPGKYDDFAKCLAEKGAKFYGAFWCPHCKTQKELFGSSIKYVDYVECSTPDGNGQLSVCRLAGISTYPTWVYADGTKETGTVPLEQLSAKTGCSLTSQAA